MRSQRLGGVSGVVALQTNNQWRMVDYYTHVYALISSPILVYTYRHIYMYVCFNNSVLATYNLYIPVIIRLHVRVARRFAQCIHTCDPMFKGLHFNIHAYLYFL